METEMAMDGFWTDRARAEKISREFGDLKNAVGAWESAKGDCDTIIELITVADGDSLEDIDGMLRRAEQIFGELESERLFSGEYDALSAILSIHAGAGGTDAQDWAEILLRMYLRFAEQMKWKSEVLSETVGTEAGLKSVTVRIAGSRAYGYLKAEAGTHRLVRLSPFNADALRQTSFALVDVVPEVEDGAGDTVISPEDIRIDTFMSGGKGGQSVNTTYSAVRIVHIPTGITVQCQNERSQAQNKETAMKVLRGRLIQRKMEEKEKKLAEERGEVVSASWGSQIRSYVLHPYKMVKDHRTQAETSDTDAVLRGDIMRFIQAELRRRSKI